MVTLSRIYTRTGDDGTTSLGDFSRTTKMDPRLVAYADTDEANSALGIAATSGDVPEAMAAVIRRVQNDLFDVGADLCTPLLEVHEHPPLRVQQQWIEELERDCDLFNEGLPPLRSFILPGGSALASALHLARTITRRAERSTWHAIDTYGTTAAEPEAEGGTGGVNPLTATYLNRLSDLLFILSRAANAQGSADVLWVPGGGREAPAQEHSESQE
ncbi:MAG: cob(I)yrinic acid a,c-diamide adenosyltransferase [Ornithinimicrobium sp.]